MTQQISDEVWEEFKSEIEKVDRKTAKVFISKNVDHKQFWDKFLTEDFPAGDINDSLEKNFAIWIIQNEIDLEQVKQQYQKHNWRFNSLLGWLRKVNSGQILNYNPKEIKNWCSKANKEELLPLLEKSKKLKVMHVTELLKHKTITKPIIKNVKYEQQVEMGFAPSRSFKSLYYLYQAVCIASGRKFLNKFKTRKCFGRPRTN